MKPLTFTLKEKLTQRVDLSSLIPDELDGKPLEKIRKIKLAAGKKNVALDSLFEINGTDTQNIVIKKSSDLLDSIGRNMTTGSIDVRGPVGDRLGQEMAGGSISVKGNAGDWPGTAMKGGRIEISGNAGNFVGGALPGQQQGLKNGMIHIRGNVGDRMGDRMRRGMIVVEGDAGAYTGSRMTAGTIMICGEAGENTGFSMKRGTIILTGKPKGMSATFNHCGVFELAFLKLIFNSLANSSRHLKELKHYSAWTERYAGDLAMDGQGELLILQ